MVSVCMDRMVCFVFCYLFFNDTATTEIYTYGHTLSLHDALPISLPPMRRADRATPPSGAGGWKDRHACRPAPAHRAARRRGRRWRPHHGRGRRSEEHTSELQSLMRTSYAVFCLNKTDSTT